MPSHAHTSDSTQPAQINHGVKAVLFDRDGTLLDLQATWAGAFHAIINDITHGDEEKMQAIADHSGYCLNKRAFDINSRLLVSAPSDYCAVWARICNQPYDEAFMRLFSSLSLKYCDLSPTFLPGAAKALDALHQAGIPLGIATNGTEESARRQMAHLGYDQHFCFMAGYDSGYGKKPDPGQILAFAQALQIDPGDIIMIGDSLHDIHAGQKAGAMTLAVATGADTIKTLQAEADQTLKSLQDLPLLLGLPLPATPANPRPMPNF
ncbi:MAG: HAD family hydrolase [Cohaesibacter sp.]|nr:HAD family hydrolase [Cohaesibacter sp.]